MVTSRNADGHSTAIAGIARRVADNVRDAQIMHEMTYTRYCLGARWAGVRNAHVAMMAAHPGPYVKRTERAAGVK